MQAYLAERANQPFGDTALASGRTLKPFSDAGLTAAANLLGKAERALAAGDLERATHFVGLAVKLPYDEREQTAPAAFEVGMMLFSAVVNALEDSPAGDSRWLEAAAETLSSTDGWGRAALCHTLRTVRQDYEVEQAESRTILRAVEGEEEQVRLADTSLPADELAEAALSVLKALRGYRAALDRLS